MDRLSQLRGEVGGSGDSTLDTTSPPSEAFMSANENSSKYFSLSDSTFDITPIKDVSLASTSADADRTVSNNDELMSNLSPIGNKELNDNYKIGKQIEAANILSGGVDIFDDNENSFDGDELVIDDNVEDDDKSNDGAEVAPTENIADADPPLVDEPLIEPLVEPMIEPLIEQLVEPEANVAREMEVVLHINGTNVDAIDIGNGLYLYRKDGHDELAAVQIVNGNPQHSFKFLKVRDNAEGNLEVYEEIEIEVPKEVSTNEEKTADKNTSNVPVVADVNKVTSEPSTSKVERKHKSPQKEPVASTSKSNDSEWQETSESKTEVNLNGKMMKFSESRKSPVVGSFTPMTYHSTPKKEGKPLTKTMVDLQLHPNRHSDNVKKTIEVHTENVKQKSAEQLPKEKDGVENVNFFYIPKEVLVEKSNQVANKSKTKERDEKKLCPDKKIEQYQSASVSTKEIPKSTANINEAIDAITEKCVIGLQNDAKSSKISQKSAEDSIKPKGAVSKKEEVSSNITETGEAILDSDKSIVIVPSVTNANDAAHSTTVHSVRNKKTETFDKSIVESNKPVDIDIIPVPNNSKDIEKSVNNKNELVESNIKKDIPMEMKKCESIPINEIKEVDKSNSPQKKEIEIASLKTTSDLLNTTRLTLEPVEATIESSKKSDDVIKSPLETCEKDVSSSSIQIETEESKAESITLYAIDTDESVSLMTPSSANEKKDNFDNKISEVLSKISNITNTAMENTSIDAKQTLKVCSPAIKEYTCEANDQVDSITKTAVQASFISKSEEKPKLHKKTDNHKVKDIQGETNELSLPALSEKLTPSVPMPKFTNITAPTNSATAVKLSEKTKSSIPVPKVKPSEKGTHSTAPELKPLKTLGQKSPVTDAKCSGKETHTTPMLEIKPLDKPLNVISAADAKASENSVESNTKYDMKPLEKEAPSTPTLNVKAPVKIINIIPLVKPSEKANTASLPEIKSLEMTSTTNNKTAKPDGHLPIVMIADKPKSKLIQPIVKNEGAKKDNDNVTNLKEITKTNAVDKKSTQGKTESQNIKEPVTKPALELKPVNNIHSAAVPFGKWTDVNRQEFLNKFKEVKAPINSNSKQIKNSNDLNRRDVLQKIDSQRAQTIINNTAKAQEKINVKNEAVFASKAPPPKVETKIPVKNENADKKSKQATNKVTTKEESSQKASVTSTVPSNLVAAAKVSTVSKSEPAPRDLSTATMASLIDKTIEDMINRVVPCKSVADEPIKIISSEPESAAQKPVSSKEISKPIIDDSVSLDDIEMKMNELHGIPFVERPPHELPIMSKSETKTYSKIENAKLLSKDPVIPETISPIINPKIVKENVIDIDSEEEVIEHEPITGDLELNKKVISPKLPAQDINTLAGKSASSVVNKDAAEKKDVITETDFDKFARRNSISCENYLTVNFDRKETQDAVQTSKGKDLAPKVNPKLESIRIESKLKLPYKQTMRHNVSTNKGQGDSSHKKYQSKIHSAYQSLTAKHQVSSPITIIEDKPVKVVFVESSTGFVPSQLNVQGQELSPAKVPVAEIDVATTAGNDFVDMLEVVDENKQQDKTKTKHQRKQVLTPVEAPELELIQPSDLGLENSPKKKRKIEDTKVDKQLKNLVHKKSYLLGRNSIMEDKTANTQISLIEASKKDIVNRSEDVEHKDTASAIDNLVKAAELLENQAETLNKSVTPNPDSHPNTPMKRGRGRPRKYPLPAGTADSKTPSPQKKPRLINAKPIKQDSFSDEHDEDSSEENMLRENWTMGKINENIVCPICNKLFRSENVVFKHVKHCTGVSPNRSESDKRSPQRSRLSQESEDMDTDYELSVSESKKNTRKKRSSKESEKAETKSEQRNSKESDKTETQPEQTNLEVDKDDVIVIEDIPVKDKPEKYDKEKEDEPKLVPQAKVPHQNNNLVCEFCGKKFRQLSYLVSHKVQHKKEHTKKIEKDVQDSNKMQVFSCDICKKEFRKLHHLVQHRVIHNPDSGPKRPHRKTSSEQNDTKNDKVEEISKQNEDKSAAFRCEPCDKSFRKLHHLVEHRETHDGINRQKPSASVQPTAEKPLPPPQCEICKKIFRKLHHLIEHKEQHADTSSEKSDDKSVKSALSTKDIIHECSLCYMVFPNEHSLNKHSLICSKKKRQSKQLKDITESESVDEVNLTEEKKDEVESTTDVPKIIAEEIIDNDENVIKEQEIKIVKISPEVEKVVEVEKPTITEIKQIQDEKVIRNVVAAKQVQKDTEIKHTELQRVSAKRDSTKSNGNRTKEKSVVPEKIKKIDQKQARTPELLKKRTSLKDTHTLKDKTTPTETKHQKNIPAPLLVAAEAKPLESSDDDEVRYMLNPNFKVEETTEGKTFMKIRASKRNSLQIERPSSNNLVKRSTSLQHPPKIPRLKPKTVETKFKVTEPRPKGPVPKAKLMEPKSKVKEFDAKTSSGPSTAFKHALKKSEAEAMLSTDSDDSDVKYSFPKTAPNLSKSTQVRTPKDTEKKVPRKSLAEKRKSLTGVAKRKSLGKASITQKHNIRTASPAKPIKKRTKEVGHRCDCGQLFSSAALLTRHTSLAHTPPRIRRRRSLPPDSNITKPSRKSTLADKPTVTRKSSVKSDAGTTTTRPSASTRKSSVNTRLVRANPSNV